MWDKSCFGGGESSQDIDAQIKGDKEVGIELLLFLFTVVDDLHHIVIGLGHNANLLDRFGVLFRLYKPPKLTDRNLPVR